MNVHTVSVAVARDAREVFDAFTDPRNLPAWARASAVRPGPDGWWTLETPRGEARIRFAADRDRLIADHEYRDGRRAWRVPARVVALRRGCALLLTLERPDGVDDAAFAGQIDAVEAELVAFRDWLERPGE